MHLRPIAVRLSCLVGLALAACQPVPVEVAEPVPPQAAAPTPGPVGPSRESQALATYYAQAQARAIGQGALRTDGGRGVAVSADQLAMNFERIALYNELTLRDGRFVSAQTPSRLRRWEGPVRLQAHFGASVDPTTRTRDRAILGTYARTLAGATGHRIDVVPSGGNFHVLFLTRDELLEVEPLLRQLVPGIGQATINDIRNLPRLTYCAVYAFSENSVYSTAIAVIRAEHPELLRRGCIHEELAQGLGLPNDSPEVRPSIFNDDEEYALLTSHDELLLRILYDSRLRAGMSAEEARPIVRAIARALVPGHS